MGALKSYTACAEDAGSRIDAVLAAHGLYPSRSAAARAVEDGAVYVNGSTVAKKHTLCAGDTVVYEVPDAPEQGPVQGQAIPLDIRYEDDDVLVISKQAGLVCHPSVDHSDGTLVNALVYHCGVEHLCNVQGESDRPGIVHRLDRDTTGLMLAAKNDAAGLALMADIRDRAVDRRYLALVHGVIPHDTGMIDAPIARSLNERMPRWFANALRRAMRSPRSVCLSASSMVRATTATPLSTASCTRAEPIRSAFTCSTRNIRWWAIRCTTPVRPRTPMRTSGWIGSSCIPFRWGSPSP